MTCEFCGVKPTVSGKQPFFSGKMSGGLVTPLCTDAVQCDFHILSIIENAEWKFLTWQKDFHHEL